MRDLLAELGLTKFPRVHRDGWFLAALLAGLLVWVWLASRAGRSPRLAFPTIAWSLLLWQPLVEELVFRGVLQPRLGETEIGRRRLLGLPYANYGTSAIFAGLHFLYHPPLWAAATFFPSLVFGFFRDRHQSLYPPLLLHIYYNSGYFFTVGFPS